jgi:preprotein translocase subunit SecD
LESIKRLISGMGYLEFRILADETLKKDQPIVDLAKRASGQPQSKNVFMNNVKVAEWVTCSPTEFGRMDQGVEGIVQREAAGGPEVLVLMDAVDVTGEYLTTARKGVDDQSRPAIQFSLNQQGAARLELLTSQNLPNMGAPNMRRRLGIILDKRLLSAPMIQSTISKQGMISGGSMSDREVADTVTILNTGSLPCAIRLVDEKRVTDTQ